MVNMTKDFRIPTGQRVRLKDGPDDLYQWAGVGSEGWIRGRHRDSVGYPLVYVQWDRDHWTYNGEEDKWTYEDHFDPVEEESKMDKDKARKAIADLSEAFGLSDDVQDDVKEEVVPTPDEDRDNKYQNILDQANDVAAGAESFVVITIGRDTSGSEPILVPRMFRATKTPESDVLLEIHVQQFAAAIAERLSLDELHRVLEDD